MNSEKDQLKTLLSKMKLFSNMKAYICKTFPEIIINLLIAGLSIVAAWLIFKAEMKINTENNIKTFQRNFTVVLSETSQNHGVINSLKNYIKEKNLPSEPPVLNVGFSKSFLLNPELYKYVNQAYILGLSQYIEFAELANDKVVNKYDEFYQHRTDSACLYSLQFIYDRAMRFLLIVQYMNQFYIQTLGVTLGPKLPMEDEVIGWLKGKDVPSNEEIEKKIEEVEAIPINVREKNKENYLNMIDK
jgi:hypothetical protein